MSREPNYMSRAYEGETEPRDHLPFAGKMVEPDEPDPMTDDEADAQADGYHAGRLRG